ncbi:MAG: hypothetical protein HGA22_08150 [Clostridiales bacterium]|nr:hypothetical protein [Clostridiales bacterium]
MKIEIGEKRPENYKENWPGEYDIFSHFEFIAGVPAPIFMITTLKENGMPNACLHSWSTFSGDSGGFFAIMTGLMQTTHTYRNILRDGEFCINFLRPEYYDNCLETIRQNEDFMDEISAGGLTAEPSQTVKPPRIKEAFLTFECTLESHTDLTGKGINSMIIGKVRHASVDSKRKNIEYICSPESYIYNVHSPKNPETGVGEESSIAYLQIFKPAEEALPDMI